MQALLIYDSAFGNTEQVARAIAEVIAPRIAMQLQRAADTTTQQLSSAQLLIVGAPTQAFRPSQPVRELLHHLPAQSLRGVHVAAFDTRLKVEQLNSAPLRMMLNTGGFAAPRIAGLLTRAGGTLLLPPQGFLVLDTEGPLAAGERERAAIWAASILDAHLAYAPALEI